LAAEFTNASASSSPVGGRIAFAELAKRFPNLKADTQTPSWRPGFLFRGLKKLDAHWTG